MQPDFGIWDKLPESGVANMLISGAKNLNDLVPSRNAISAVGGFDESRFVLDFGCGVGRNIIDMAKLAPAWSIVGYDNKAMITLASAYLSRVENGIASIRLESDWEEVKKIGYLQKFDVIFCCLVLQHIPEEQLRWYLTQFYDIGNELFVFGRRALDPSNTNGYDGGKNFKSAWEVILDSGYEITSAQDSFTESNSGFNAGNGNDHHWVKFQYKGQKENVRWSKRKRNK